MPLITLGLSKVINKLQVFDLKNIRLRREELKTKDFISKTLNWLALVNWRRFRDFDGGVFQIAAVWYRNKKTDPLPQVCFFEKNSCF